MDTLSPSTINRWITRSQQQIHLTAPVHRRRHRQARTRLVVACVALGVVAWLFWRWVTK